MIEFITGAMQIALEVTAIMFFAFVVLFFCAMYSGIIL